MTFNPSPYQQSFFDWVSNERGNAVLKAVAGSGKTTTIVHATKLMHDSIFIGAYNKKMADEISERVAGMPNVKASTFHSAGFGALMFAFKKQGFALKLDERKVSNIVEKMISNEQLFHLGRARGTIAKIVSMAKNRGFGVRGLPSIDDREAWLNMVSQFDLDSDLPEEYDLGDILDVCREVLVRSNMDLNVIDYDDMVYLPLQRNLKLRQYNWVLIDEAQDTNPTRREMAARMLMPVYGRLVAVGDDHQAIFGFTGADNDALQQIIDRFNCKSLPLSVTYRCPKKVVEHARQWVSHIEAHDSAPEGEVNEIEFEELIGLVSQKDAIICRYNKYLVALAFKLIRAGIPAKIEGRAIGEGLIRLCDKWKVRSLTALFDKLEAYKTREVEKALAQKKEDKADRLIDQIETMFVLIDRAEEQKLDVVGLKDMIRQMFADEVTSKGILTLCSCHRSKGMEWDRVFLLGRKEFMPSRMAKQAWQLEQEVNLMYVSVTRAKKVLFEVTNVQKHLGSVRRAPNVVAEAPQGK